MDVGLTRIVDPVAPLLQLKVPAPLALSVAVPPVQMVWLFTLTDELITLRVIKVEEKQLLVLPVTE